MTAQVIDFMAHLRARRAANTVTSGVLALAVETSRDEQEVQALVDDTTVFRGAKYHADLSTRDIPALLRGDIKAAKAKGAIPKDVKVSVRLERYAGGCSLHVNVRQVPTGFVVESPVFAAAWAAHEKAHAIRFDYAACPRYTPQAQALRQTLSDMTEAYQNKRESLHSDYSNVNFYGGDVHFDLA